MSVKAGIDVLLDEPGKYIGGKSLGLITTPAGVTKELISTLDVFHNNRDIVLEKVFGLEHGIRGEVQDAIPVESFIDRTTGLPVYSLYGEERKPTDEMLDGLDALVFDVQDVGARYYTYTSTMTYCMEAAKEEGISLYVLDRPNPIGGREVEGNIPQLGFESFVGLHPIPIRHGLTIGELAKFINTRIRAELKVIKMEGWKREMWFNETGLTWVQPSPNIPTIDTATVYPGTCLFEGVNISEGRGTTRPFEYLGAPWIDGGKWGKVVNSLNLKSVKFRSCYFTPSFGKYENQLCEGIQVHVVNRDKYNPVKTTLYLLSSVLDLWPEQFQWLPPKGERHCHFDLLAGTDKIRSALSSGIPVKEIIQDWGKGIELFRKRMHEHLLYEEKRS